MSRATVRTLSVSARWRREGFDVAQMYPVDVLAQHGRTEEQARAFHADRLRSDNPLLSPTARRAFAEGWRRQRAGETREEVTAR